MAAATAASAIRVSSSGISMIEASPSMSRAATRSCSRRTNRRSSAIWRSWSPAADCMASVASAVNSPAVRAMASSSGFISRRANSG